MKTASFFLTVCLVLMAAGTVHAAVYTEANAYWGNATDSGFKPYSSVDYTSSYFQMSATAEADNNWLKGISQADVIAEATNEGNAETISRFTTTFEVISDGLVSFDYLLDGEMEIYLHSPGTSTIPFTAYYALSVSDSISSDSVNVSDTLFEYEVGTYVLPVDLIDTYQFGGTSYEAGPHRSFFFCSGVLVCGSFEEGSSRSIVIAMCPWNVGVASSVF